MILPKTRGSAEIFTGGYSNRTDAHTSLPCDTVTFNRWSDSVRGGKLLNHAWISAMATSPPSYLQSCLLPIHLTINEHLLCTRLEVLKTDLTKSLLSISHPSTHRNSQHFCLAFWAQKWNPFLWFPLFLKTWFSRITLLKTPHCHALCSGLLSKPAFSQSSQNPLLWRHQ